jgi:cell division protein FtsZ
MEGLEDLRKNVDCLVIISNDKLRDIYGNLSISQAFSQADNILCTAAKGIAEIITVPGYVNVDFEDVNTTMRGSGVAIMGTAAIEGENRAFSSARR